MYRISRKYKVTEINDRRTRSGIDNDKLSDVPQYSCNTDSESVYPDRLMVVQRPRTKFIAAFNAILER